MLRLNYFIKENSETIRVSARLECKIGIFHEKNALDDYEEE